MTGALTKRIKSVQKLKRKTPESNIFLRKKTGAIYLQQIFCFPGVLAIMWPFRMLTTCATSIN
jgi:hypothetical protein